LKLLVSDVNSIKVGGFLLHISISWVKIRLQTENQLPRLPGFLEVP
jgi:hypothetical protein